MALLIAFAGELAGAGVALAMFSDPIPTPPPVYGGQAAVHAQYVTGRTLGPYHGAHARRGRHGSPATAPTSTGAHVAAGRHRATVTS